MRRARLLAGVSIALLSTGACTIEQDLSPRIDAAGAEGQQGNGATDPSEDPSSDPNDDPSLDPSEEPSLDPSEESSEEPSEGPSDEPTEEVTPVPGNVPPNAGADDASTAEDAAVVIDVLANDRDPDGDPLTPAVQSAPGRGRASVAGDAIRYVPDADVTGTDRFTYAVRDGRGGTSSATVTVTIRPLNDAPAAVDDQVTTPEDTTVTIDVLANDIDVDGDTLSLVRVGSPSAGSARVASGKVVYDPSPNVTGEDSFTYTITDPGGLEAQGTVTVDVGGHNDPPVANNDSARTTEDRAVTIDVLGNDSDPDGDSVSIKGVGNPAKGSAVIAGGQVTYTPDANVNGTDTFTYTVRDPSDATDTGTVTVTITPANDPPVASNDTMTVAEDSGATVKNVVANDSDIDGNTLTVTGVTQPALGNVTFSSSNVTFTPKANANGSTSFTYTVEDPTGAPDTATVNVTITPVNDAPVA